MNQRNVPHHIHHADTKEDAQGDILVKVVDQTKSTHTQPFHGPLGF